MRVGFDISQTGNGKAGCGFFAEGLIQALVALNGEHEYFLYPSFGDCFYDPDLQPVVPKGVSAARLGLNHPTKEQAVAFWRKPPPTYEQDLGSPDIIHANNFFAPKQLTRARLVYTLYDLSFLENHSWTPEENRWGCFNGIFEASVEADWIIAISKHTLGRFKEYFPHFPEDRTSVIYPASRFPDDNAAKTPACADLPHRGFWLSVGTIEPRKNHLALLQAYAQLKGRRGIVPPLVLAGGTGWMMGSFHKLIHQLGLQDDVRVTGYADDDTLGWLYANALCHVYVSLYEGFGMPVLESMSCGTPVIASRTTSIPEIMGIDGACGRLVDPEAPEEICKAMEDFLDAPEQIKHMSTAARTRAALFSWRRSAVDLQEVYRDVLRREKNRR